MATIHKVMQGAVGPVVFWQTGRWYSDQGQRVAAHVSEDGTVYFLDFDRGIDGTINPQYQGEDNVSRLANWVMHHYDNGNYVDGLNRTEQLFNSLEWSCKHLVAGPEQ